MPLKQAAQKFARTVCCMLPPEREDQAGPAAIQPGPDPGEARAWQPARPYQDYVQDEARRYWQEICKIGSLRKPGTLQMFEAVPLRIDASRRMDATNRYARAETEAMQSRLDPGSPLAKERERPYRAFVESEARKYWEETGKEHDLTKPTRQEIRAAAMPVLCRALRNRTGHRRHQAVASMVQHAREQGWIKWPLTEASASSSYIDALVQLADDANWLAREIPLPDHPPPRHPPIYYTIGSRHGRPVPVPRDNAVIRGNYLYLKEGRKLTDKDEVIPKRFLPAADSRHTWMPSKFPLTTYHANDIDATYLNDTSPIYYGLTFERAKKPLNRREVSVWFDWKEVEQEDILYYSCQLRDYPYLCHLHFSPYPPGGDRE